MTQAEYSKACEDIIYLTGCALKGTVPDEARLNDMNLSHLYAASKKHLLTAAVSMALESGGVSDRAFTDARAKAIRKVVIMDSEMGRLFERFESMGIWYMPLKGTILKDDYPAIGMREMADHDILFDSQRADDVRGVFKELGFTSRHFGGGVHDVYYKEPVCNFEMHRKLFGINAGETFMSYYEDVKDRLVPDKEGGYGCHFSLDDSYIYLIAHEYKHFASGGTGLRSVVDTYVFLEAHEAELDMDYIGRETEKLAIADFERKNRSLALHLFDGEPLSDEETSMLSYMAGAGVYGNVDNRVRNKVERLGGGQRGRVRYFMSRLVLPMSTIRANHPRIYKSRILIPFYAVFRLFRGVFFRRNRVKAELKAISKLK